MDREQYLIKLRDRHNDFNGYAREILSDTLSNRSSSNPQKLQPSAVNSGVDGSWNSSSLPSTDQCEMEQIYEQFDDEAELLSFLGSEDHHKLMEEISEALQAEYQDLVDEYDINIYEDSDFFNDSERLQEEAELNEFEYLICPICR